MVAVGRRGDRQNPADRLDPVGRAMIVAMNAIMASTGVELRLGKICDALRRISLA